MIFIYIHIYTNCPLVGTRCNKRILCSIGYLEQDCTDYKQIDEKIKRGEVKIEDSYHAREYDTYRGSNM